MRQSRQTKFAFDKRAYFKVPYRNLENHKSLHEKLILQLPLDYLNFWNFEKLCLCLDSFIFLKGFEYDRNGVANINISKDMTISKFRAQTLEIYLSCKVMSLFVNLRSREIFHFSVFR